MHHRNSGDGIRFVGLKTEYAMDEFSDVEGYTSGSDYQEDVVRKKG